MATEACVYTSYVVLYAEAHRSYERGLLCVFRYMGDGGKYRNDDQNMYCTCACNSCVCPVTTLADGAVSSVNQSNTQLVAFVPHVQSPLQLVPTLPDASYLRPWKDGWGVVPNVPSS